MSPAEETGVLSWDVDIPLATNRFILWDLLKVSVLSPAIMWTLVALMGWFIEGEPVLLPFLLVVLVGAGLFGGLLFACLLLGNRVGATFSVGPGGASYESGKRERRVNRAVAIVGLLAGSPSTAGAGLLAMSSEAASFDWSDIITVRPYPRERVIVLRNSWRVVLRLYCPPETYPTAAELVSRFHAEAVGRRIAAGPRPSTRPRPAFSLGWTAVVLAAGLCAHAWYWVDSEQATRAAVAGTLLLVAAGWFGGPGRRILAAASLPGILWHAVDLTLSATDTFESWDGSSVTTATLDTGMLVLAAGATAALVAMGAWRLLAPNARR